MILSFISVYLLIMDSTTTSTSSVTKNEIVKKQLKEEKDPNIAFQVFCILEDNKSTYKIGSYKIFPKNWMIAYLLDWVYKSIKSHLKTREILFNFKRKSIVEQVIMNTENSRKGFLQEIDFEVGDSVLLTSWITELPNIRIRSFKKENPMKDTKGERDKKLIASKQK